MAHLKMPTHIKKSREQLATLRNQLQQNSGAFSIHLSIDPGSHKMGVAAFDREGKYLCSVLLKANPKDPAARRLHTIRTKFESWFSEKFGDAYVTVTTLEHLPPNQITPSLPISAGCIVACQHNVSRLTPEVAICTNTWKSVAKQFGCNMRDPKGVMIFRQIPWEFPIPPTEDEADAVIIYLAYSFIHRGYAWLGPTLRVKQVEK